MVITFEQVTAITKEPIVIIGFVIIWFLPLLIYLILGVTVRGRSASGKVTSDPMISNPNYFIPLIIWGLIQLSLFIIFLVFPMHIWIIESFFS